MNKTKLAAIISLIVIFLLGVVYFLGVAFFGSHYAFRTSVILSDGTHRSITGKSSSTLIKYLSDSTNNCKITFIVPDKGTEMLTFQQLGIKASPTDSTFNQNSVYYSFSWPFSLFKETIYQWRPVFNYDLEIMENSLKTLQCMQGITQSKDAFIEKVSAGVYEIRNEIIGDIPDFNYIKDLIQKNVNNGNAHVYISQECYIQPKVKATDEALLKQRDYINTYANRTITLDFAAGMTQTIGLKEIEDYSIFENNTIKPNTESLATLAKTYADQYNWRGKDRIFHTSTGQDITINSVGETYCDYLGWELDQEKFVNDFSELLSMQDLDGDNVIAGSNIENPSVCTLEVPWSNKGCVHDSSSDIGNTYVEVSISNQHMYFYENGNLIVDTDVVTGMDSMPGRRTPTGLYKTSQLDRNHWMHGPDYTVFCKYFIRCTTSGVAIHDATRSRYGGNIYKTNGSHGCINTPPKIAKIIFESLKARDTFTPIIIW